MVYKNVVVAVYGV